MKSRMILCALICIILNSQAQYIPFNIDQRLVVEVGYNTTTSIVFDAPVQAADYGSGDLLANPLQKILALLN